MKSSLKLNTQKEKLLRNSAFDSITQFISRAGFEALGLEIIASDCSKRRYFRVADAAGLNMLVLDSSEEMSAVYPFLQVAGIMNEMNLRAPKIYYAEPQNGFILLEDFGPTSLKIAIEANPNTKIKMYDEMVDILVHIANHPTQPNLPDYNHKLLYLELSVFKDWCITEEILGFNPKEIHEELFALFKSEFDYLTSQPKVMTLRDYHVENLMLINDGSIGIIDFQDAVLGHPSYDLVSLLQDARIDVTEEMEKLGIERFLKYTNFDRDAFLKAYYILGLQRGLKIIGIFNRKYLRDGTSLYMPYLPRVVNYCYRCLNSGYLPELKQYFQRHNYLLKAYATN